MTFDQWKGPYIHEYEMQQLFCACLKVFTGRALQGSNANDFRNPNTEYEQDIRRWAMQYKCLRRKRKLGDGSEQLTREEVDALPATCGEFALYIPFW